MGLGDADKAAFSALMAKVDNAKDKEYLLEELLGRKPNASELPGDGKGLLDSIIKLADLARMKGYKLLRKYEGPQGDLSFPAWLKAVEPLAKDDAIPEEIKKEYVLRALSTEIYNSAVAHQYTDLATCKELVDRLNADWGSSKDLPTLTSAFYRMKKAHGEDLLNWVQRVRAAAEEIKEENSDFNVLENILIQLNRGSGNTLFTTHIHVGKPSGIPELVKLVKEYVTHQAAVEELSSRARRSTPVEYNSREGNVERAYTVRRNEVTPLCGLCNKYHWGRCSEAHLFQSHGKPSNFGNETPIQYDGEGNSHFGQSQEEDGQESNVDQLYSADC